MLLAAVLVFLAVETALLGICSRLNSEADELWLRRTLTDPAFYLTEAGVLCIGALTALIGANEPWFVFLLIPVYAFLQMSVLHRPLQELATRDAKTGLLHFNAWQRLASDEIRRLNSGGHPWAVLFADIDNFRFYNQRHGHLGGDEAIHLVAQIITARVRPKDVTARFGGEEFCVLLPETSSETAGQIAERIRLAIAKETSSLPESVTVSVGVAAVEGARTPMELAVVLALADEALYAGKAGGPQHCPAAGNGRAQSDREQPSQAAQRRAPPPRPARTTLTPRSPFRCQNWPQRPIPHQDGDLGATRSAPGRPASSHSPSPCFDLEGVIELVEVAHHLVAAELGRGMRVDGQQPQQLGVPDLALPGDRPGPEETLRTRSARRSPAPARRRVRSARPERRCRARRDRRCSRRPSARR